MPADLLCSWIDLCQRTYKSRYWICRAFDYGFPSLDSVSVIIATSSPQFMDFQQAFDTGVLTTQHIMPNCAPVQMTYASRAIMHDIEFVETIVIIYHGQFLLFIYRKADPSEQLCSWHIQRFQNSKILLQFNWPISAEPSCMILVL